MGPEGISQEARCHAHLCTCLSACVCVSLQGWHVCSGMEEGEVLAVFPEVLEKRHGLPLEGLPHQCGAQHLVASSKKSGSRHLTLDMQHEGWEKQTRKHILLSRKAADFSVLHIEVGGK